MLPGITLLRPSGPHRRLVVVLARDNRLLPLASRDMALEKNIYLTVGPVLHLREVDPCQKETDESSSGPNVTGLADKISALSRYISKWS